MDERIAALLGHPPVKLPAEIATPGAAVEFLLARLADAALLPFGSVVQLAAELLARPCGIGREIALPRIKCSDVERIVGVIGYHPGISWPTPDGHPVRAVVLILQPLGSSLAQLREIQQALEAFQTQGQ